MLDSGKFPPFCMQLKKVRNKIICKKKKAETFYPLLKFSSALVTMKSTSSLRKSSIQMIFSMNTVLNELLGVLQEFLKLIFLFCEKPSSILW